MDYKEGEGHNGKNSEQRKNYERRLPNFELFQSISKDGRYQIVKMVQTFVVPIRYIEKVYNTFMDKDLECADDATSISQ